MEGISTKLVSRISLYRRVLAGWSEQQQERIFSHQLAELAGVNAALVRRDLMRIGFSGSPARGYDAALLAERLASIFAGPGAQAAVLVGVGHLGRAILAAFAERRARPSIVAAFDRDSSLCDEIVHGCRCHPMALLRPVVRRDSVDVGIVTVPAASAQEVADRLVEAGVRGLLNFAPARLRVPPHVFCEDVDLTAALDKTAFFARLGHLQENAS